MVHTIKQSIDDLAITYDDNGYIFAPPLLILIIEVFLFVVWDFETAIIISVPLVLFLLVAISFHLYRKTEADSEEERRQIQSLISIHHLIDIRAPLPPMTRWAAQPELCCAILEYADLLKPSLIVEAGSGVSTIVTSYWLEQQGGGHILSLDHDATYGSQTREKLKRHGLSSYADIIHAPLKDYTIDGEPKLWYDLSSYDRETPVDMVVVDGPPVKTQPMARFPALPLLYDNLSEKAVIILDDAARTSESKIVDEWLKRYPEFSLDYRPGKKGIAVLSRNL